LNKSGDVTINIDSGVGKISFFHPRKNALSLKLLEQLSDCIDELGNNNEVRVLTVQSGGQGSFCAGASLEEIAEIKNEFDGREYFMGFARILLSIKRCPKFVVTRVQGKVVGGGIGLIAASDYVLALDVASLKFPEFSLGFGPFVVGSAVQRKIGLSAFAEATIDTKWKGAHWAKSHGLYNQVYKSFEELDKAFDALAVQLTRRSSKATTELKKILWQGMENWEELLIHGAKVSGKLILSNYSTARIKGFWKKLDTS